MNATSRTSVVTMLLAAELLIAGMAVYSLRGGNIIGPSFASFGNSGVTSGDFVAKSIAPISAGLSPRVTIADPDSGVMVSASSDGLVHVKDDTYFHGFTWFGNHRDYPQLNVSQGLDGVHIARASAGDSFSFFGDSRQHIEVQIPAGSTLVISNSEHAWVSGLTNGATVISQDGYIELSDMRGPIVAHSNDGHVTAKNVTTDSLQLSSDDGYIEALNLTLTGATHEWLHSNDGHVTATGAFPANGTYDFSSDDGKIRVSLEPGTDATIDASTGDGAIRIDGVRQRQFDDGDPARGTLHYGSGASSMRVHSQDGDIYITTNGVH